MKNLGKIAILLLLLPHVIYAGVTASVDLKSVTLGEMVTLSLNVSGEDIQRPNIQVLCDTDVISTSSQTSIQMINGDYRKNFILSYKFMPQESCTINPIDITIGNQVHKTKPISIEVKPASALKDADFILTLQSNKKSVFVGEPFEVTLLFKQKNNAEAVDSKFIAPVLKGFWIKEETKPRSYREGNYTVTEIKYTMAAQRFGTLKVEKAQMQIASRANTRDSWGSWIPQIKWRSYFSNDLSINVMRPPASVDLVGDLSISVKADKTEINANEAINVTVEVNGEGNLEDIKSFKPYIDGVSVFDEKISIKGTKLTQKMAFISDSDFTIPPFTLKYFNPKTKDIQSVSTKEISVKVKNAKPKEELKIKRQDSKEVQPQAKITQSELPSFYMLISLVSGFIIGVVLTLLKPWRVFNREKSISLKDPKALLIKLLPYKHNEDVKRVIDDLESSIYSENGLKVEKKVLKDILKKYEIKTN